MIIKGNAIEEVNYRKGYDIGSVQDQIDHFAVRTTTPRNPFTPEPHDGQRFWYILEGEATVTLEGVETAVEPGDLILVAPWTKHSLQTETRVRWICFG